MKTKKATNSKNVSLRATFRQNIKWVVLAVVVIAVALQGLFDYVVYQKVNYGNGGDQTIITSLISQSVHDGLKNAPVEPQTGNVYFPEAKFYVPAGSSPFSVLLYSYQPADSVSSSQLNATTKQAISVAESSMWGAQANSSLARGTSLSAVFDKVPALQFCARGVHVLFDAKSGVTSGYISQGTRQLADGRTLYIYTEPNSTCQTSFSPLIAQLKHAESY